MRTAKFIIGIALLAAEVSFAQLKIGDNTQLRAGGLGTFGYAGDYGNEIPSSHGLNFGLSGDLSGFYYNPNFLSFSATPYINQSRDDSASQSITGASGIAGTANLFTGSNYPGSISYHYDANSTGTFGLAGLPNFTTHGRGDGFAIGWSALVPDLPTLSVGYSQGSGSGTVYGTDQQTSSSQRTFNLRSNYSIEGFRLNGFFDHTNFDSKFPEFLTGQQSESVSNTSGHDFGFGATHQLPLNGTFYANFTRATSSSDYFTESSSKTGYTDDMESSGVSFHPTQKLGFFFNDSYTSNLSAYFSQSLATSGIVPVNFGSGSHSVTLGGGVNYQFTSFLWGQAQATHYDQYYFGHSYTGTFVSGSLGMTKRLWDLFGFSATVIESDNGQGSNAVGFVANVNYFHPFGRWLTSGNFSYAQNVQTILITYTTSSYNYSANVRRGFAHHLQWTSAFNGSHSGLTQQAGNSSHSEGYSTSLGTGRIALTGNYGSSTGLSYLGPGGLQTAPITPGLTDVILFSGRTYGGGLSGTPVRKLLLSATFNRAISNTDGSTMFSRNNTEIFNAQMQYRLRRIGLQAGYTRFMQGISIAGLPPANFNSFFVGISRWFDIF